MIKMKKAKSQPKEKLKVFDLFGQFLGVQDRVKYYKQIKEEFCKKGKVTRQVQTIKVILMNRNGGIYVTKRSRFKNQNSLLYDKTIGANIKHDESKEYTLLKECSEEMGFPAAILSEKEFNAALKETDLETTGIFKEIATHNNFMSERVHKDGNTYVFPQIATIYVGVYDGRVKFRDGETSGVELYYPNEIEQELLENPDKYTGEAKFLIPKLLREMKNIIRRIPNRTFVFTGSAE